MKDYQKIEEAIKLAFTDAEIYEKLKLWNPSNELLSKTAPTMRLHEWEELIVKLKWGKLRYFLACETSDSLFSRWSSFVLREITHGCTCCLYWQGFLLGAILTSLATLMT